LIAKPEGQRPFLRSGRKWEGNIKLAVKQVVRDDAKWIHVAQDRDKWQDVKNTVMEFLVQK
jgi:hypothetical protein